MPILEFFYRVNLQFISVPTVFVCSIVIPFIDLASDHNDVSCNTNNSGILAHTILFALILVAAILHVILVLVGKAPVPELQSNVRTTVDSIINKPLGLHIGNFLELCLVTYWQVFVGPEPLSCWILITSDEFNGFQGGRAGFMIGIGVILYGFIAWCTYRADKVLGGERSPSLVSNRV